MTDIDTQVGKLLELADDYANKALWIAKQDPARAALGNAIRAALQSRREPAGEAVAWALRRKCNGYVRGVQTTAPSEESMEIAEIDGEEYIALYTAQLDQFARNRDAQQSAQAPTTPVDIGGYVHPVPNHCDRITWRGSYYHLPLSQVPVGEAVAEVSASLLPIDDMRIACNRLGSPLPDGTLLYTAKPDQSARIAELEESSAKWESTAHHWLEQAHEFQRERDEARRQLAEEEAQTAALINAALQGPLHKALRDAIDAAMSGERPALSAAIAAAVEPWRKLADKMQRHMLRTTEADALTVEFAALAKKGCA